MEYFSPEGAGGEGAGAGAGAGEGAVQMEYGNVPLAPLLWLDDILNGAEQIEQARRVNEKIIFF